MTDETRGGWGEVSVVVTIVILVALVKIQIGHSSSRLGIFSGVTSMSPFLAINFSLLIET